MIVANPCSRHCGQQHCQTAQDGDLTHIARDSDSVEESRHHFKMKSRVLCKSDQSTLSLLRYSQSAQVKIENAFVSQMQGSYARLMAVGSNEISMVF
jgi:hypothetical protein